MTISKPEGSEVSPAAAPPSRRAPSGACKMLEEHTGSVVLSACAGACAASASCKRAIGCRGLPSRDSRMPSAKIFLTAQAFLPGPLPASGRDEAHRKLWAGVAWGYQEPGSQKGSGRVSLARPGAVTAGPPARPMAADAEPAQAG